MKYKITDFKVDFRLTEDEMITLLSKKLHHIEITSYQILRKSVDARKNLMFIYHLMIETNRELSEKERKSLQLEVYHEDEYLLPCSYEEGLELSKKIPSRPVIIGSGPSGLFACLILAQCGFKPILLERGEAVEDRIKSVSHYNHKGELNPESNIQFGEGGAGTFSDGKLNTGVKDHSGRRNKILKSFVECGALENILYDAKPHIGTDYLIKVVANMRKKLQSLGAEIRFNTKVDEILFKENRVIGIKTQRGELIPARIVVLAIGHSARDTFEMLYDKDVDMQAKPFAVGFRVEHSQNLIDRNQYGKYAGHPHLHSAEYKLTYQAKNGRRVYSFCMCPGGRVVNSASEYEMLVCNGMSYQARDLENSNSAILIGVDERDYGEGILAGMNYQRKLEKKAFELGGSDYSMPIESFGDFKSAKTQDLKPSSTLKSSLLSSTKLADLTTLFSQDMNEAFLEAMNYFGSKIKGFDDDEIILTAVESRSSSPVRITRNADFISISHKGLYPCGEGAGYAGGIMSAALDGIKTAEKIIEFYKNM